jgi:Alr-MurF fusion protein
MVTTLLDMLTKKGVRKFVVKDFFDFSSYKNSTFFVVSSCLTALQNVASFHRSNFDIPIIAITGSVGKTTVKEWLYHLLSEKYRIVRSPKSYNSQIGVALSLLQINKNHEIAIIEAGISQFGEMEIIEKMICPKIGIFTSFGNAHSKNFDSKEQHFEEKNQVI